MLDKKGQDAVHFGQCYLKLAIGANLQAKAWRVFAFASLFGYFSRGGMVKVNGVITQAEFMQKLSAERAMYQAMLGKMG